MAEESVLKELVIKINVFADNAQEKVEAIQEGIIKFNDYLVQNGILAQKSSIEASKAFQAEASAIDGTTQSVEALSKVYAEQVNIVRASVDEAKQKLVELQNERKKAVEEEKEKLELQKASIQKLTSSIVEGEEAIAKLEKELAGSFNPEKAGNIKKLQTDIYDLKKNLSGLKAELDEESRAFDDMRAKAPAAIQEINASYEEKIAVVKRSAQEAQAAAQAELEAAAEALQISKEKTRAEKEAAAEAEKSSKTQIAAFAAIAIAAKKAFSAIISDIKDAIATYNEYSVAMLGLQSAGSSKGYSNKELTKAAEAVVDEFMNITQAAQALKNLMDRGFTLDQAISTINSLKNSAALTGDNFKNLGNNVVTATEAIKNHTPAGLRSAGVTKTLTQMQEEYAAALGTTVDKLSDAQKAQAEYEGTQAATASSMGDLAKLQDTLAGAMAKTAKSGEELSKTYGEALAPEVELVVKLFGGFLDILTAVTGACPPLTAGLTSAVVALTALTIVSSIAKNLDVFKKKITETGLSVTLFGKTLKAAVPELLAIGAAIAIITGVYTAYQQAQEKAAEAEAEAAQKREQSIANAQNNGRRLSQLADRYDELSNKTRLSYSEMKEMRDIEKEVANTHLETGGTVQELAKRYNSYAKALREAAQAEAEFGQTNLYDQIQEKRKKLMDENDIWSTRPTGFLGLGVEYYIDESKKAKAIEGLSDFFSDVIEYAAGEALEKGIPPEAANILAINLKDTIKAAFSKEEFDFKKENYAGLESSINEIFSGMSDEMFKSIAVIDESKQKMVDHLTFSPEDITEISSSMDELSGVGEWLQKSLADMFSKSIKRDLAEELASQIAEDFVQSLFGNFQKVLSGEKSVQDLIDEYLIDMYVEKWSAFQKAIPEERKGYFTNLEKESKSAISALKDMQDAVTEYADAENKLLELERAFEGKSREESDALWNTDSVKAMVAEIEDAGIALDSYDEISSRAISTTERRISMEQQLADMVASIYDKQIASAWEYIEAIDQQADALDATDEAYQEQYETLQKERALYQYLIEDMQSAAVIMSRINTSAPTFDATIASAEQFQAEISKIEASAKAMNKELTSKKDMANAFANNAKAARTAAKGTEEYVQALKDLGLSATATDAEIESAISDMAAYYDAQFSDIESGAKDLESELLNLVHLANLRGDVSIDTEQALAAIRALINEGYSAKEIMEAIGVSTSKAGGGGGGGGSSWYSKQIAEMEHLRKMNQLTYEEELAYLRQIETQQKKLKKDEKIDLQERLYQVQEDIRQKAIDDDYAYLEHQKHINQMSLTEELAYLQNMLTAHQMNADELIALEEKIYDVREAIRTKQIQDDYNAISHAKAMDAMSLQEELSALEQIRAQRTLNAEEALSLEESIYSVKQQIRRKAIEDDYADLEHEKRMGRLSYQQEIEWLERIAQAHQMTADEQRQVEEELYDAREAYRQALLAGDYAALEHRKRMGELTLEQELETLQAIKAAREMNAEELLKIEEELYAQEQAIRSRDASSITKLMSSLTKALSERYKAMRDEETALLEASKDSWQEWSDDNVAAIQAQIDALDALLKKEDSENQDAKELKQIAKLQESIQFEQDEYNRKQLQAQLDKVIADRETRLRRESIEAEKEALKEQQELIKEQAKAEQDAIDGQIDEIKKNYDERLKAMALQAEAEQLLLSGNQDAILALLRDYEVDYNATGQTLGEALLDGFMSAIGNVDEWFNSFNSQVLDMQTQLKNLVMDASAAFNQGRSVRMEQQAGTAATVQDKTVTVSQTYNFYEPIESPSDVARKTQQTLEDMARML